MWEGGRPWKTQCWGLQAAAVRPGQAVQNQLSPAPSQGVSYKQKEKAFLIHVLFPLLLWASQALEGGGLWAGSSRPVHGQAEGERLQGPFPLQQFGLRGDRLPSDPQVTLPSLEEQPLIDHLKSLAGHFGMPIERTSTSGCFVVLLASLGRVRNNV